MTLRNLKGGAGITVGRNLQMVKINLILNEFIHVVEKVICFHIIFIRLYMNVFDVQRVYSPLNETISF